jgi:hypothetical protein
MNSNFLNSKYYINHKIKVQFSLLMILALIVSPISTIIYKRLNLTYNIAEPIIAFVALIIIAFYSFLQFKILNKFGHFIPLAIKLIQLLSFGIIVFLCALSLLSSGSILLSEIVLAFVVYIPVETYVVITNRNRVIRGIDNINYNSLNLKSMILLFLSNFIIMVLFIGIYSQPLLLIALSILLSIPLFFLCLTVIDIYNQKKVKL